MPCARRFCDDDGSSFGEKVECNVEGLPGRPAIVLSENRAIFVHGCLWHGHDHIHVPSHLEGKIRKSQERDRAKARAFTHLRQGL